MPSVRVVKLGGSLLDLVDWPARFVAWLSAQPAMPTALIVGGGELADAIRRYDRDFALGDEAAHWLCIRATSLNAEMAAAVLRRCATGVLLSRRLIDIEARTANGVVVFDPEPFLRDDEPNRPGEPLPHGWHVTSDSIAARVAECLDAAELVLLKCATPPANWLERPGDYVDGHFAVASRNLRSVRCVDLRGVVVPAATARDETSPRGGCPADSLCVDLE